MEIQLNGEARELTAESPEVDDVIELLDIDDPQGLAVAVNHEVVPRSQWEETELQEGDRVEVIRATQGG